MRAKAAWLVLLVATAAACFAADELSVQLGWTYNKGGRRRDLAPTTTQYDVSGAAVIENVQSIATNAGGEALLMGDVTDPGFAWFQNLSTNDRVEIGCYDVNTNFVALMELRSGEKAVAWLSTAAPRALAYTNAVQLDYVIIQR